MKGLVAVVLSYGCLAIVAALFFTSGALAAPVDRGPAGGKAISAVDD